MKIAVSSASGIEAVTKRELYKLLGINAPAIRGRITFDGGEEEIAKCNLFLRTASRVYIELGEFKASTFDELFDETYKIPFDKYIPVDGNIQVIGKCYESNLMSVTACQSIVKKAICGQLEKVYKKPLTEKGDRYKIEFSVFHDIVTIMLDTSGEGLHKRGYRGLVGEAPLKETMAAAIVLLSVWNKDRVLADLFCGTGTIPIEAAMIGLNMPAGINRSFDFEHFEKLNFSFFEDMKNRARENINYDAELKIFGFDIDGNQLKLARKHASLCGVDKYIHFQKADMRDFKSRFSYGIIISNPPYGERLMTRREIERLYSDFGRVFNSLDNWCCYALTPVTDFERLFKRKADKKRKLYNGKIECNLYEVLGKKPESGKRENN